MRFPLPNHPGLAGSGFEFSLDNVGVLLGFSVFSLLASELEVVPLALSASSRSEANGVFSEAVNKNKSKDYIAFSKKMNKYRVYA